MVGSVKHDRRPTEEPGVAEVALPENEPGVGIALRRVVPFLLKPRR